MELLGGLVQHSPGYEKSHSRRGYVVYLRQMDSADDIYIYPTLFRSSTLESETT